ncbi:MAG TPA: 4-(cytidine 5'-diphospho)-2-C-methyl-D-erythritol kinase [Acidimicrobiales bacterium]|jgi:4-diphosphocytidyl-2-C-methyl-D-erythritol kinase|nr:4-(cytidine 5'-diphospho)-2-C-methyl-D-erythritol kinase [Acidimicrobiales bacterium]
MQRALAKLTRSLRVVGVRGDGFHLIEAEMVTLDLADTLAFGPGDGLEMVGPSGGSSVPEDETNLVRRALAAVGRRAHVRLEKRIPAGAGLGGGSADAAAVLRWAGVSDPALACALGADVPFCVVGGRALVSGVGEVVEPMEFEDCAFVLLTPPFGVSTAAVYRAWDELGGPAADGPNDLEAPALAVEPRLARWRDALGELTGRVPVLAGSGSTWFVEGSAGDVGIRAGTPVAVQGAIARIVEVRTDRPSGKDLAPRGGR